MSTITEQPMEKELTMETIESDEFPNEAEMRFWINPETDDMEIYIVGRNKKSMRTLVERMLEEFK